MRLVQGFVVQNPRVRNGRGRLDAGSTQIERGRNRSVLRSPPPGGRPVSHRKPLRLASAVFNVLLYLCQPGDRYVPPRCSLYSILKCQQFKTIIVDFAATSPNNSTSQIGSRLHGRRTPQRRFGPNPYGLFPHSASPRLPPEAPGPAHLLRPSGRLSNCADTPRRSSHASRAQSHNRLLFM
jgi:hypothetical protein